MFSHAAFERARRVRFERRVVESVQALATEGEELQRMVVEELAVADLRDLGIEKAQVLQAAGLLG